MKILSQSVYSIDFYSMIIFYSIVTLFFSVLLVLFISGVRKDGYNRYFGIVIVITSVAIVASGYGVYRAAQGEPRIQYKATITDFNQVYKNDYKIVDRDGDIFTLEKEDNPN